MFHTSPACQAMEIERCRGRGIHRWAPTGTHWQVTTVTRAADELSLTFVLGACWGWQAGPGRHWRLSASSLTHTCCMLCSLDQARHLCRRHLSSVPGYRLQLLPCTAVLPSSSQGPTCIGWRGAAAGAIWVRISHADGSHR